MAETKIFSVADLTDRTVDQTLSHLTVKTAEYAIANGVVADKKNVTWKERCFIKCQLKASNNLDLKMEDRNYPWRQVTSANFPGLTDFLDQWKIIFDGQRLDANLLPA